MAYRSNFLDEDEAGNPGVVLSRHIKKAASHAMKQNIVHPLQAIFKEDALHTGFSIIFRAFECSCRS